MATLFVAPLQFGITAEILEGHFKEMVSDVVSAKVRKDSQGRLFGFVNVKLDFFFFI
jgi:hypothetical protein